MARGEVARLFAPLIDDLDEPYVEHLPGQHDQSTHNPHKGGGGRSGRGAGSSGSASQTRANDAELSALEEHMFSQHPGTYFDFTGADPKLMEGVCKQLGTLMTKYPDVAKTLAYIGTGKDAPPMYEPRWEANAGTIAKVTAIRGRNPPYQVMNLNPDFFGMEKAAADATIQQYGRQQWFAEGSEKGGMEYMVTHEYGHCVMNYLEGAGQRMKARASSDVATDVWQFTNTNASLGDRVSIYAQQEQNRLGEQFAEGFASLHFAPPSMQATYTKKLGTFLNKTLPNGSSASWKPMK